MFGKYFSTAYSVKICILLCSGLIRVIARVGDSTETLNILRKPDAKASLRGLQSLEPKACASARLINTLATVEDHLVARRTKSLAIAPPVSPKPVFSPAHSHNAGNAVSLETRPEHGFGSDQ